MGPPVSLPAGSISIPNHPAAQITGLWGNAPRRCSGTPGRTGGYALQWGTPYEQVTLARGAGDLTDELGQMIPSGHWISGRAGMTITAGSVHFSCRNPSQANARPFSAPNRPVAVPDTGWSTRESLLGIDDLLISWGRCTSGKHKSEGAQVRSFPHRVETRRMGRCLQGWR